MLLPYIGEFKKAINSLGNKITSTSWSAILELNSICAFLDLTRATLCPGFFVSLQRCVYWLAVRKNKRQQVLRSRLLSRVLKSLPLLARVMRGTLQLQQVPTPTPGSVSTFYRKNARPWDRRWTNSTPRSTR